MDRNGPRSPAVRPFSRPNSVQFAAIRGPMSQAEYRSSPARLRYSHSIVLGGLELMS